ncbi:MAG TPA: GNAT family N-acetyltransferase [Anaerolineales bacterium]|nr:GNAT family N-acetyltransferase [Anaerolineales bacterium]
MMDLIIREAQPEDAERILQYVQSLINEPEVNLLLSPGEFALTREQEQNLLSEFASSDNSVYFLAERAAKIVGTLICQGGRRRAIRHTAGLSMSVAKEWRNQGIGSLLLSRALEWAKHTGIVSRIELDVFARNEPAIHLYQKFGFVTEGCRRNAIYRDGRYHDDLLMAFLL